MKLSNIAQQCLQHFNAHGDNTPNQFLSLPHLATLLGISIERLPVSLRIILESVLRHIDDDTITIEHLKQLASWQATAPRTQEIPFHVARVVLQDFTGVPLLADLASMREVARNMHKDVYAIEPLVPVDLVVDHSIQIDDFANAGALHENMRLEFERNQERYAFMKWAMQAFKTFRVVPPGVGIVHQVNLEYLAPGLHEKDGVYYPDTLVGTDSHTTMINGAGVVAWGVGGIEAEAAMLGQPVYLLMPDVVGVELRGQTPEGITATDIVLTITEFLRQQKVVGQIVEFFGEGAASLSLPDRATIANMAPEYGATMGFFAIDDKTLDYFLQTGRKPEDVARMQAYYQAQGLFGIPRAGNIDYSRTFVLDLHNIQASIAGPKRPQDRIALQDVSKNFTQLLAAPIENNGFAQSADRLNIKKDVTLTKNGQKVVLEHGSILIAAITSCTNTSNPSVLIAAGLLAKKAVEKGLKVASHIKTSLAPGSRVVTEYLQNAGLLPYLEQLGFYVSAYGCSTCIGNAGDLLPEFNQAIVDEQWVCAAVLSGNRNFEARIHPNIKANFLASPPLVVAYAIAGNMRTDISSAPLGFDAQNQAVYLKDIWPSHAEIAALMHHATQADMFRKNYATLGGELWDAIQGKTGANYDWPASTYIANPPFFQNFDLHVGAMGGDIIGARVLAHLGNSITTDHISPAGNIKENSPAGIWLKAQGVQKSDFNSYGARRGHHEVMMRGTFANVRIKNLLLKNAQGQVTIDGGYTKCALTGEVLSIYDAAMNYQAKNIPSVIIAGEEYGTGSSRDWAAKGTQLLGVKAVIAKSFERIHRANLIGMGVLALEWVDNAIDALPIDASTVVDILGLQNIQAQMMVLVRIQTAEASHIFPARLRIDTPIEVSYFQHQGILPYVLRELLQSPVAVI